MTEDKLFHDDHREFMLTAIRLLDVIVNLPMSVAELRRRLSGFPRHHVLLN